MLAVSACSASFVNPVQAVATRIAEVGIVGYDARAARRSPLGQAVDGVCKRLRSATQLLVMSAEVPESFPSRVTGDYGFDPLGLSSPETLSAYREAEIKHGRLAMLAAVAWPLQEILHPILVDAAYSTSGATVPDMLVASGGASPSLLNGGLFQPEVLPALALSLLVGSFVEETSLASRRADRLRFNEFRNAATPGDLQFDPLNLYKPLPLSQKLSLHEAELLNGRLAMLAVASYVGTEAALHTSVVRATPALFEPLILVPWFRAAMDAAFSVASMDGSIDGIAY